MEAAVSVHVVEALKRLVSTVQFCPSAPFLTSRFILMAERPGTFARANGLWSFPFGKSGKVECGNSHSRRDIKRFYVAAERDGKSSDGLSEDLS